MKKNQIPMRDPFVLPVASEQRYYLFGTTDADCWDPAYGVGFDCYRSRDLEEWEGPFPAFRAPDGFWAVGNFWAPEVHAYRGKYYMFASFIAPGRRRAVHILVAERPEGPYRPLSAQPVTPPDWECLDGTLYVDETGAPWLVFCHEWVQIQDGTMEVSRLSDDLTQAVGQPQTLFRASEAPWVRPVNSAAYVTDGPFLLRREGQLWMLWSSMGAAGYAMGIARSTTGRITGPWEQQPEPLFGQDGGHGMYFRDFAGREWLTSHTPNSPAGAERPVFFPWPTPATQP